jgi:hypothetical protein
MAAGRNVFGPGRLHFFFQTSKIFFLLHTALGKNWQVFPALLSVAEARLFQKLF